MVQHLDQPTSNRLHLGDILKNLKWKIIYGQDQEYCNAMRKCWTIGPLHRQKLILVLADDKVQPRN